MRHYLFLMLLIFSVSGAAAQPSIGNQTLDLNNLVEIEEGERMYNTTGQVIEDGRLTIPSGLIVLMIAFLAISIYGLDLNPQWLVVIVFGGLLALAVKAFYLPWPLLPAFLVISVLGVYLR